MTAPIKPPMPYFGGKSRVAPEIWRRFGDCPNYVEPFAGSLAVLLNRPTAPGTETVNDLDHFLCNFWRAVQFAPEECAKWADWPVNETDLEARHYWLLTEGIKRIEGLAADPQAFDAMVAGWWVWGACCWIGGGWCSGDGPWIVEDGKWVLRNAGQGVNRQLPHLRNAGQGVNRQLPHLRNAGQGVNRKLPHLGDAGTGVNRKLPHLRNAGQGVNRQLPHLGDAGQGVNRKLPHLGNAGKGVNRQLPHLGNAGQGVNRKLPHLGNAGKGHREHLSRYFGQIADRLRYVRVACGDWSRVLTPSVSFRQGVTGVLLDPPYGEGNMEYAAGGNGCATVAISVREWAIANQDNPDLRIALCGYEGQHEMPASWEKFEWKAAGGYASTATEDTEGKANRHRERVWFSPHCLKVEKQGDMTGDLFG